MAGGLGSGLGDLLPLLLLGGQGSGGGGFGGGGGGLGGLGGLLPLLLLGSGGSSSGSCGGGSGSSCGGGSGSSCDSCSSSGGETPASFAAVLTSLIGDRVKIFLPGQTFVGGGPALITGCLEEVGSDFVVLTRIAVNGTPIVDPRRLTIRSADIVAIERLSRRDQLLEFLVQLCD